jgi:uncharacterized protein
MKPLIILLCACGAVLVYMAIRLYFRQWSFVFKPSKKMIGSPSDMGKNFEEYYLQNKEDKKGKKIHCWWIPGEREENAKAVIFFHSNTGNISFELKTMRFLSSLGLGVLMIDYPGYGKSEGKPGEKGCYRAADAAWDFLRMEKGFPAGDIIVYGQSLGGALAAYLASKHECCGLVFQSGFTSIPDMAVYLFPILAARWLCHTRLNSLKFISRCKCPVLILHSEDDEFVPVKHAHKLYSRAPFPKKIIIFKGSHYSFEWQSDERIQNAWKESIAGQARQWMANKNDPMYETRN